MLFHLALVSLASAVVAQDLGVPLSWREFNNSRPLSERITIAQNAINEMTPQLDSSTGEFNGLGYWQSGNVWSVLANQDHSAGTTTNKALVVNNLNLVFSRWAHYDQFGWWAQAALYGYRAYGDTNLLAHAVDVWTHVTGYVITAAQAAAGKNPNKSFTIESTCNGITMAGGVFWRPTTDDTSVNSITTGLYLTLSAFLAEYTGNATYTQAAILSANWIKNHNINANDLVLDTVDAQDCSTSPATWLFTYNSGKYIEGLSVLAVVAGDTQWSTLMINILNAAVKTTVWQGSNGVITEGASPSADNDDVGFKAILIRGLHEAWTRNPSNTALRTLIHSYGDVQYNALLELAATGNTYSSSWLGPPQAFTSWGQLAALDVMTANIDTN
ncbi:Glycoside hydrolase family 76 protein [Mycena sanguinolenta]|uniref:Glycoside hydrolase family 76 protein n=1 Tax=Mycena sanguinolenta TaxID=230812 RepID=A0A8H6Z5L2_9AGAR|nr:Glycoside hydrolase family 76 protein [Mycena sanguinolenta]